MTKRELLERIEALERRVAHLEGETKFVWCDNRPRTITTGSTSWVYCTMCQRSHQPGMCSVTITYTT